MRDWKIETLISTPQVAAITALENCVSETCLPEVPRKPAVAAAGYSSRWGHTKPPVLRAASPKRAGIGCLPLRLALPLHRLCQRRPANGCQLRREAQCPATRCLPSAQ